MSASKTPFRTVLLLFPMTYFCLGIVLQLISAFRHPDMPRGYHAGQLREVLLFLLILVPIETVPYLAAMFMRWRLVTSMPALWLHIAIVASAILSLLALDMWKGKGGDANILTDLLSILFWLALVPFLATTLTLLILGKAVGGRAPVAS